jgi:hypothetical protein
MFPAPLVDRCDKRTEAFAVPLVGGNVGGLLFLEALVFGLDFREEYFQRAPLFIG